MYESLSKIYYKQPQAHEQTYHERYKSPFSVHLPFEIKQFNHNKSYSAFYNYTPEIILQLEEIYKLFVELLRVMQEVPPIIQHQFALFSLIEEVHSTSDIEGIHSTQRELKEVLDGVQENKHFSSVVKKYELLMSGEYPKFETCEEVRKFYDEFAHADAIAANLKNKLDGKIFRKEAVDVQSSTGKTIHRGLEPEELVISKMSEALKFLNSGDIPELIKIAVFHYLFVYIHPFYDGNGRTARFISSCYLVQALNELIGLRLSVIIKKNTKKYYDILKETDAEINCGDLTPFIICFLEFISSTIKEISHKLARKMFQFERIGEKLLRLNFEDEDAQKILLLILQASSFYGRGLSIYELMNFMGKSRNTIKKKLGMLPVRAVYVPMMRKKFYKIDWKRIRN